MASDPPPVPLPPPPLAPDAEPEPDWRLSWWTVLYMALCGLLVGSACLLVSMRAYRLAPIAWMSGGTLTALAQSFGARALVGLGVVLADRHAPASWPRSVRWAVGAGLGALIAAPGPWPMLGFGPAVPSLLLSRLLAPLASAVVAAYLASVLRPRTRPWRRMPLAGMEAHLIVIGASWGLIAPFWALLEFSAYLPLRQWQGLGSAVAHAALTGLLVGCAFAAGLTTGRRAGAPEREAVDGL